MKEFHSLKLRAVQNRNQAIAQAHADYETALAQIATLEHGLLRQKLPKRKSVAAAIDSLIPREGTFTYLDIKAGLEALDPGRVWKERTIHCHLSKLREKGIIRRLKRATQKSYTIYVRAECAARIQPLDDMSLAEVVRKVLTKPMTSMEVVLAVTAFGYRSEMPPRRLQKYVGVMLRRGGYEKDGERWQKAGVQQHRT